MQSSLIEQYRPQPEFQTLEQKLGELQRQQDAVWKELLEKFPLEEGKIYALHLLQNGIAKLTSPNQVSD